MTYQNQFRVANAALKSQHTAIPQEIEHRKSNESHALYVNQTSREYASMLTFGFALMGFGASLALGNPMMFNIGTGIAGAGLGLAAAAGNIIMLQNKYDENYGAIDTVYERYAAPEPSIIPTNSAPVTPLVQYDAHSTRKGGNHIVFNTQQWDDLKRVQRGRDNIIRDSLTRSVWSGARTKEGGGDWTKAVYPAILQELQHLKLIDESGYWTDLSDKM